MALAMAGAAMVTFAGEANAATYLQVTNVSNVYSNAPTADLYKTSTPTEQVTNARLTPQTLTGYYTNAPGTTFNLFAYCVDIFETSGTGKFEVVSAASQYTTAKYNVLAQLISAQGSQVSKTHDAAVQLAIWEVINETMNVYDIDKISTSTWDWNRWKYVDTSAPQFWAEDISDSSVKALAESYIADAVKNAGKATPNLTLYVAKNDGKQDMLFWTTAVPAVPEPATWGMMLIGMGVVGYSMRRRKVDVSFA